MLFLFSVLAASALHTQILYSKILLIARLKSLRTHNDRFSGHKINSVIFETHRLISFELKLYTLRTYISLQLDSVWLSVFQGVYFQLQIRRLGHVYPFQRLGPIDCPSQLLTKRIVQVCGYDGLPGFVIVFA